MYGSELSDAFLRAMRADGRSPATISTYRRALARFGRFLFARDQSYASVTQSDLIDYRCSVQDERLADRTQHLYSVIISVFYKWLHAEGHVSTNPAGRLKRLPAIPSTATPPRRDDFERLVYAIGSSSAIDARDRAILLVLFSSGLRVSELCSLRNRQIDLETGEFVVVGKGNKRRPAIITGRALEALREYVERWRHNLLGSTPTDWLWLSSQGGQFLPKQVRVMMERRRNAAGLTERRHYGTGLSKSILAPHAIRHLHATAMFQAGVPLPTIQASLGHASLETTQIYLDVNMDDLRRSRICLDGPVSGDQVRASILAA